MDKKELNLLKLHQISKLPDNWNGFGTQAFPTRLIELCKEIIQKLEIQPSVFPTGQNSIQFEYEKPNGDYLEFELYIEKVEVFFQSDSAEFTKIFTYDELNWNEFLNIFLKKADLNGQPKKS